MRPFQIGSLLALALLATGCDKPAPSQSSAPAAPAAPAPPAAAASAPPVVAEAPKEDSYVLARKNALPAAGSTRTQREVMDMDGIGLKLKIGLQSANGTMTQKHAVNEVMEGLGENKARRTLASKTAEDRMVVNTMEYPSPDEADPLQGIPVIVEHKDGAWSAVLESGTPTEEQEQALGKVVEDLGEDPDFAMFGDTPRKPGDKWEVDPKNLDGLGGAKDLTGSFTVEFVEVKEFRGIPCAVLKQTFDLLGVAPPEGQMPVMDMSLKGEGLSHRSLADFYEVEGTMTIAVTIEGSPEPGTTMKIEGPMTVTREATLEKK